MPKYSVVTEQDWVDNFNSHKYIRRHNTDPFVFGNCFYYAYCRQGNELMKNLDKNTMILFGNFDKQNNSFMIDTLFIIDQKATYTPKDVISNFTKSNKNIYINYNDIELSKEFIEISTFPLYFYSNELRNKNLSVYSAVMQNTKEEYIFSYFPCSTGNYFDIPSVKLLNLYNFNNEIKGVSYIDLSIGQITDEWNNITNQILSKKLYLGTYAQSPH